MEKRILIFDDDADIIDIMKYVMEEKGWEVRTARQSNDAITEIRSFDPALVLMDNNIPDLGGVFVIKNIKLQVDLLHIPIVLFSAHTNIRELAADANADAYLAKPFNLERLYKLIDLLTTEPVIKPGAG